MTDPPEASIQPMSKPLVRFVHISDTHIEPEEAVPARLAASIKTQSARTDLPDNIRAYILSIYEDQRLHRYPYPSAQQASIALVTAINRLPQPIDFVLHTGDITHLGSAEEYRLARDILSQLQFPVHYLHGNHDDAANLCRVLLNRDAVLSPYNFTFEVSGVLFVCLDSVPAGGEADPNLSAAQLAWLEGQLQAGAHRPVVVAMHHPPFQIFHEPRDYFMLRNATAIRAILQDSGPQLRAVFCGHVHAALDRHLNSVYYSVAPKPYSHTPGFSVVTVTDDGVLVERHSI